MQNKLSAVKKLKDVLGKDVKLILTGSAALHFHGLVSDVKVGDIDLLIVGATPYQQEVLNNLQKSNPSPKFKEGRSLSYSFYYENVKIDIWKTDSFSEGIELFTKDGLQVANVKGIVAAKLSYNRPKDWIQLAQISKGIFDPAKFEKELYSIPTDGSSYDE